MSIRVKKIDHVAICVADIDAAASKWREVVGLEGTVREVVASQKTEALLLPVGEDGTSIELISPAKEGGNEGLAKFLEKRGPGLHHVAIEVEGIEKALAVLSAAGRL